MNSHHVFVSVGGTANDVQEKFVLAVEARLRAEGLIPHTVGRNEFSDDAPLKTVARLMDDCKGTVVIALERKYFPSGVEKRGGPAEKALHAAKIATPWNQIEAALAYGRGHPLMVLVEEGVLPEGLLEKGHDWYVQTVPCDPSALASVEFNGVMASWKAKVAQGTTREKSAADVSTLTVGDLVTRMKPAQLWSLLGALGALVVGAFALGSLLNHIR